MPPKVGCLTLSLALISATLTAAYAANTAKPATAPLSGDKRESGVLWSEPADIKTRNLYYGPGGEADQPHGPFTFLEEDLNGTNPKFLVRDANDVKWTVKLGNESRPETVATRLVWAVGYFSDEDYFLPDLQVNEMPAHLKRGQNLVSADGSMHAARLKRHHDGLKSAGDWQWGDSIFTGTRELNGLKVMMALINNWDLKDVNNKVFTGKNADEPVYIVSDLGASFGTTGLSFPFSRSKGDLKSYVHSKFIGKVTSEYVDFRTPSPPSLIYAFGLPAYVRRVRLDGVLHHVPLDDARWMGHLLANLSADQIHDAFRAAGYPQKQVESFSSVVEARIERLNRL